MTYAFSKKGYDYLECSNTGTLIVNPRPTRKDLSGFYKNSKSNEFWYEKFFLPKLSQRVNFTIKPKINYLIKNFKSYQKKRIIDIGCGSGDFLVHLKKNGNMQSYLDLNLLIKCPKNLKKKKLL